MHPRGPRPSARAALSLARYAGRVSRPGVDDWFPLEEEEHLRQLAAVRAALRSAWRSPRSAPAGVVVDLGAGDGRIARPLAEEGWSVVAVDRDPAALRAAAAADVRTLEADFAKPAASLGAGPGEALGVLCLGHTFMLLTEPLDAQRLLRRIAEVLRPGGFFAVDAFVDPLWEEVAEGSWQTGLSEDARWQMIWRRGESIIALRQGDRVDPGAWTIRPDDLCVRLWTWGELRLLAANAGFEPPATSPDAALILFRRP